MTKQLIDVADLLDYIEALAEGTSAGIYKFDPRKKLCRKEMKAFQAQTSFIQVAIWKGLILANSQPELAASLVEQMNQEGEERLADKLLEEMLFKYKAFLYQRAKGIS